MNNNPESLKSYFVGASTSLKISRDFRTASRRAGTPAPQCGTGVLPLRWSLAASRWPDETFALVDAIPFARAFVLFGSLLGIVDDLFPGASDFDEAVGKKQFAVIPYSRFVRVQDNRNHLVFVA